MTDQPSGLNFPTLLAIATRSQKAIEHALEAAFGAAIVTISLNRPDHNAPFDKSILPEFEKAYARIVIPVIDTLHKGGTSNEVRRFIVGQIREQAIEENHDFFMERANALIEESRHQAHAQEMRDSAPLN